MEHHEAHDTQATERYLLGEMNDAERDLFEAHFFDCPECAADVRAGMTLMAAGRDVTQQDAKVRRFEPNPKPGWRAWFPQAAAAAVIFAILGWLGGTRMNAPAAGGVQLVQRAIDLETGLERGPEAPPPAKLRANEVVRASFFVPPHDDAASYLVSVRNHAGRELSSNPVTRQQAAEPVELVLRALPRGSYLVVIEGVRKDGNRFSIAEIPFDVVGES